MPLSSSLSHSPGRRVRSITTRIETPSRAYRPARRGAVRRVRSITTRIETSVFGIGQRESRHVDESVPSQQGLKRKVAKGIGATKGWSTSPFHHNKD